MYSGKYKIICYIYMRFSLHNITASVNISFKKHCQFQMFFTICLPILHANVSYLAFVQKLNFNPILPQHASFPVFSDTAFARKIKWSDTHISFISTRVPKR